MLREAIIQYDNATVKWSSATMLGQEFPWILGELQRPKESRKVKGRAKIQEEQRAKGRVNRKEEKKREKG